METSLTSEFQIVTTRRFGEFLTRFGETTDVSSRPKDVSANALVRAYCFGNDEYRGQNSTKATCRQFWILFTANRKQSHLSEITCQRKR